MSEPVLLVLADQVHTLDVATPVRALLIRDGVIADRGDPDRLREGAGRPTVLDLTGTTITPGITDSHIHLTEWAFARREVDLSACAAAADAAVAAATAAGRTADGWLRGRGWNAGLWADPPHRRMLDALLPDRPVALQSHDMHALWVNSAALDRAGIDESTPDPEGGRIVRDPDGRPTGLLLETAGQLVARVLPAPGLDQAVAAVHAAQHELHSLGITAVHSFPGIHLRDPHPLQVVEALRTDGRLALRVLQHIALDELDRAIAAGRRSGGGDAWVRLGGVKLFLDGALGSRTAWLRTPYEDGSGCGMRTMDPAEFRTVVATAAAGGIASTVHAIGDAAVGLALDVLADRSLQVPAMPHRIEHVQCCPSERLGDAAAAGLVCSMQPAHLMTDWRLADRFWGTARSRSTFAFAALLQHRTTLAFGSDAPVEPVDPRRGLHAAVFRTDTAGSPVGGWFPGQRISARDALLGYTVGAARAGGLAAPAGTLAIGAPADFVAWDTDPLAQPASLLDMRCVATVVDGAVVYTC